MASDELGPGIMIVGVITLWSGWGNAVNLSSIGPLCAKRELRGLHLDNLGRIVYADPQCPLEVYDNAYIVFLLVSLTGIFLISAGYKYHNK